MLSTKIFLPNFTRTEIYENFLVTLLRFLLVFVLLLPLVVSVAPLPDTIFPYLIGKVLFFRITIEVMLVLWILLLFINSKFKPRSSLLFFSLSLFLFISVVSSLFSVDINKSFWSTLDIMQGSIDLFHWFVYFLILISINHNWNDWIKYFNYQLIIGLIFVFIGLLDVLGLDSVPFILSGIENPVTLGNSSYVAFYLSINFFIAFALLSSSFLADKGEIITTRASKRRASKKLDAPVFDSLFTPRIFWSICLVLTLVLFYFVAIDFHWITFSLGIIAFSGLYLLYGKVNLFRTFAICFLVLVPVLLASLVDFNNQFDSLIAGYQSGGLSYFGHLSVQLSSLLSRPIFGWGPGNFLTAFESNIGTNFSIYFYNGGQMAYNYFVEKIISLGIFGFISILVLWGSIFYSLIRNIQKFDKDRQIFLIVIFGALVSYFFQIIFIEETHVSKLQIFILIAFISYVDLNSNQISLIKRSLKQFNKIFSNYKKLLNSFSIVRYINLSFGISGIIISIFLIFFVNIPIFKGSKNIIKAINPQLDWTTRVDIYSDSINLFPPLANHYRMMFLNQVLADFSTIDQKEFDLIIDFVHDTQIAGIVEDPYDWRIYVASAGIYQYSASYNSSLLLKSSELVDRAEKISPNRIEILQVKALQNFAERNLKEGFKDLVEYIDQDPASLVHLTSLLFVFTDQFQQEIFNGNNFLIEESKAIELISLIAPQTDRTIYLRARHHLMRNEIQLASSLVELHIKSNQFVGNKIIELKAEIDTRLK